MSYSSKKQVSSLLLTNEIVFWVVQVHWDLLRRRSSGYQRIDLDALWRVILRLSQAAESELTCRVEFLASFAVAMLAAGGSDYVEQLAKGVPAHRIMKIYWNNRSHLGSLVEVVWPAPTSLGHSSGCSHIKVLHEKVLQLQMTALVPEKYRTRVSTVTYAPSVLERDIPEAEDENTEGQEEPVPEIPFSQPEDQGEQMQNTQEPGSSDSSITSLLPPLIQLYRRADRVCRAFKYSLVVLEGRIEYTNNLWLPSSEQHADVAGFKLVDPSKDVERDNVAFNL